MGEEVGKIFVGGVDRETQQESFRGYFEKFGKINDIILMMDKERPGVNKGFGFVTFADPAVVEAVVDNKHHMLDGKTLDCKHCKARGSEGRRGGDQQRTKKVFVGGISQQCSEEDLSEFFKQQGVGIVEEVHIMSDKDTGKHRGFGFVTMDSEEAVEKLVQLQHLELKGKLMEVKKAMPKQNRFGGGGYNQGERGGSGNYNQGGFGGGQYGQQGGYGQQRGGYGGQQGGYNNGYRQQQQGGYSQQPQQQGYAGAQSYGGYTGGYGQPQQDPYGQQQQQQPQYGGQGSMGNYAQEASGYGPQRGNYNQGYNQGQQQQAPPQQQSYAQQPVEGGQDYGNYGKANMGNTFHPYSR